MELKISTTWGQSCSAARVFLNWLRDGLCLSILIVFLYQFIHQLFKLNMCFFSCPPPFCCPLNPASLCFFTHYFRASWLRWSSPARSWQMMKRAVLRGSRSAPLSGFTPTWLSRTVTFHRNTLTPSSAASRRKRTYCRCARPQDVCVSLSWSIIGAHPSFHFPFATSRVNVWVEN